jgi:hypothetical protein
MYLEEKVQRERFLMAVFFNIATSTYKPLLLSLELHGYFIISASIREQTSDSGEFTAGNLSWQRVVHLKKKNLEIFPRD